MSKLSRSPQTPAMAETRTSQPAAKSDRVPHSEVRSKGRSVPEKEVGGRNGPDPTRYGDWEKDGRCIDF